MLATVHAENTAENHGTACPTTSLAPATTTVWLMSCPLMFTNKIQWMPVVPGAKKRYVACLRQLTCRALLVALGTCRCWRCHLLTAALFMS